MYLQHVFRYMQLQSQLLLVSPVPFHSDLSSVAHLPHVPQLSSVAQFTHVATSAVICCSFTSCTSAVVCCSVAFCFLGCWLPQSVKAEMPLVARLPLSQFVMPLEQFI